MNRFYLNLLFTRIPGDIAGSPEACTAGPNRVRSLSVVHWDLAGNEAEMPLVLVFDKCLDRALFLL